jgi:hypothetical protein
MTLPLEFAPALSRSVDRDGAARFSVTGDMALASVYRLSAALVRDLLDGHRAFVLDLTHAGEIDARLWSKLVDWTLKLEQIRRPGEPPSRFSFDGVRADHRAAIRSAKLDRLYEVRDA